MTESMRSKEPPEENTPSPVEANPTGDRPENTATQQQRKGRFLLVQGQEMNTSSNLENVIVEADSDGQKQQQHQRQPQQPIPPNAAPAPTHDVPPQSAAPLANNGGDKIDATTVDTDRTTTVRKGRFQIQQSDELVAMKGIPVPESARRSSSVSAPTQKGRFQILNDSPPDAVEARSRSTSVTSLPPTTQQKGRFLVQVPSNESAPNDSETTETKPREAPPRQPSRMKGRFLVQPQSDQGLDGETAHCDKIPEPSESRQPSRQKGRFTLNPTEASSSSPQQQQQQQQPEVGNRQTDNFMGSSPIVSIPEGQQVACTDAGDRLDAEQNNAPQIRKRGRFVVTDVPLQGVVTSFPQIIPVHQPGYGMAPTHTNLPTMQAAPVTAAPPQEGLVYNITPALQPSPPGAILAAQALSQNPSPNQHEAVPPAPPKTSTKDPHFPPKARSMPTSRPTPSVSGKQGFGKMLYFLDQMRLEVTDADRTVRTLQTDMKCMKQRNKELEALARDMERKWKQEKEKREAAEQKVKALKKKLNALKDENRSDAVAEVHKEDASVGTNFSRTDSLDGTIEFLDRLEEQSGTTETKLAAENTALANGQGTVETINPPYREESLGVSPQRAGAVSKLQQTGPTHPGQKNVSGRGLSRSTSGSSTQGIPAQMRPVSSGVSFDGANTDSYSDRLAPVGGRSGGLSCSVFQGPQTTPSVMASRHSAADFDPLRPSQTESQGSSVVSEPIPTATQMFVSPPVVLANHGHFAVLSGPPPGSTDLMDMQASIVHIGHPAVNGYLQGSITDNGLLRPQMQMQLPTGISGNPSQHMHAMMPDQSGQEGQHKKPLFDPLAENSNEESS